MPPLVTILTYLTMAYDNSDSLLDELMAGDWYGAIVGVYSITLGSALFHAIIFLAAPTLIAIKYQQFRPVALFILIGGTVFSTFFTDATLQFMFGTMGLLGFAGILYSVVHK